MLVEAGLPVPAVGHDVGLAAWLDGDGLGVGELALVEVEGPWGRGEGLGRVAEVPAPEVGHAHVARHGHVEVGAGEGADRGVTGAVSEEGGAEALLLAGPHVDDSHSGDPVALCLHAEGVVGEEEVDVLLSRDDLDLEVIEVDLRRPRAQEGVVGELLDDVADVRVLADARAAVGPHAHLGGGVAAEDGAVLDEGDLAAHARAADGRSESGEAAAQDDEVIA